MYLALGWLGDCDRTVQIDSEHPLFKGCTAYTEDEIEYISTDGTDEQLILALRSCLRYNVARICGKWESTIPFMDDMINEGMLAIVEWVPKRHDSESEHSVMKRATSAIVNAIEEYINANQSLAAPCAREQKRRIARGEEPTYVRATLNDYTMADREERDPDTYKRDVMEALEAMTPKDEIDVAILRQTNWSKSNTQLAEELGVPVRTLSYRRHRLYKEFLEITR
jgi:hypothetical protein